MLTESELCEEVVAVLQGVVLHQRARWGALLGQQRQFEGWWKAEFAMALEAWAWSSRAPDPGFCVVIEPKPRNYGAVDDDIRAAADLLVVPWDKDTQGASYEARPRLWIEIKTRATWWGTTASAVTKALSGLRDDLAKWEGLRSDALLTCHLVTHDGTYQKPLPAEWTRALEALRSDEKMSRWLWQHPPYVVGIEAAVRGKLRYRWTRMDCAVAVSDQ